MPDIRISSTFFNHKKTLNLIRECDYKGAICLIRLWNYTAEHYPDGDLSRMNEEEIEIASGWIVFVDGQTFGGEPGKFYRTITSEKSKFLDVDKDYNIIMIHDWIEHQPWIIDSKKRSNQAKEAAKARWNRFTKVEQNEEVNSEPCRSNAAAMREHEEEHAKGNAPSNARTVPYRTVSNKLERESVRTREGSVEDFDFSVFEEAELVEKVFRSSQPRNMNQFYDAVTKCQERFKPPVWKAAFEKFTLTSKAYSMKALLDICEEENQKQSNKEPQKETRLDYLIQETVKRITGNIKRNELNAIFKRIGATDDEIVMLMQSKLIMNKLDHG